ncbi:MAG: hypothetical protein J6U25_03725 [Clostridia bacterium]|nr:hypothetical protein [Clostridia bacterium]
MVKNLGKCECPHFFVSGAKSYVSYSVDGVIYLFDLTTGEREKICFGDEYLPVGNGRFLIREGQNYKETKEI